MTSSSGRVISKRLAQALSARQFSVSRFSGKVRSEIHASGRFVYCLGMTVPVKLWIQKLWV